MEHHTNMTIPHRIPNVLDLTHITEKNALSQMREYILEGDKISQTISNITLQKERVETQITSRYLPNREELIQALQEITHRLDAYKEKQDDYKFLVSYCSGIIATKNKDSSHSISHKITE